MFYRNQCFTSRNLGWSWFFPYFPIFSLSNWPDMGVHQYTHLDDTPMKFWLLRNLASIPMKSFLLMVKKWYFDRLFNLKEPKLNGLIWLRVSSSQKNPGFLSLFCHLSTWARPSSSDRRAPRNSSHAAPNHRQWPDMFHIVPLDQGTISQNLCRKPVTTPRIPWKKWTNWTSPWVFCSKLHQFGTSSATSSSQSRQHASTRRDASSNRPLVLNYPNFRPKKLLTRIPVIVNIFNILTVLSKWWFQPVSKSPWGSASSGSATNFQSPLPQVVRKWASYI